MPIVHPTALVIEDPFIRAFVASCLTRRGYNVRGGDVGAGIEALRAGPRVDVLITNEPAKFAGEAADIPLLYLAAAPDPKQAAAFERFRLLRKPFRPAQILAALDDLLGGVSAAH